MHHERNFILDCLLAGFATSGACIFSNPMEVVKTRMQLQGEASTTNLSKISHTNLPHYRGFAHAFYTICKTEGVHGIQRGMLPAMVYNTFMNAPRLGLYEPLQVYFGATDPGHYSYVFRNICAASVSGMVGAIVANPFYLVKARMQSASLSAPGNSRFVYSGVLHGLSDVMKSEGVVGLFRGVTGGIPRVVVGSSAQLATYTQAKTMVIASGVEDGIKVQLGSSLISGLAVTTAMNPFDVVSTRLYNQQVVDGKGSAYSGVFDCLLKTVRLEGVRGLYKGWTASYLRQTPHSVFTFIFWEQAKKVAANLGY